jgi:hypothetical protein
MDEKSREAWEVSLASLQDHRKIATVGAHCNGCGQAPLADRGANRPAPAMDHGRQVGAAVEVLAVRLAGCGAVCDRAVGEAR